MLHIRTVTPQDISAKVVGVLDSNRGVFSLTVLPAAARNPDGDVIEFDVLTSSANDVLATLRRFGIDRRGSIAIDTIATSISEVASAAGAESPYQESAPVWEEVEATIRSQGTYPPSFYGLLVISGLIAAIGIMTNSQILVVGAMVVCPDYGAIANIALGINKGNRQRVRRGLVALATGFSAAIVATFVFSVIIRGAGKVPRAYTLGLRPVSNLINSPNLFSVVVAVLAGLVGVISLTESRANTLIGVFISVTTIPAAADVGVSSALHTRSEAVGSLLQLLLNVTVLVVVGSVALRLQRQIWKRITARTAGAPPGS
jgi:uncharacterized hydrophobic protein (TIGR00271 family)